MADLKETTMDHVAGEDFIVWCSSEQKWINQIHKYATQYPDDVQIRAKNKDGSLVARLPYSWFRAPAPKVKRAPMSDEQRAAASEWLSVARASRKHS